MKNRSSWYPIAISMLVCAFAIANGQSDKAHLYSNGKMIFQTLCSSCHGVHQEKIGPMLASVTKKRDRQWLVQFIRNSQSVIASGDDYANFLYSRFNQQVMPSFNKLSSWEIDAILVFVEQESKVSRNEIEMDLQLIQNDALVLQGREIFRNQCATCHSIHYEGSYGPALGSVTKRRSVEWLIPFIHNSQKIIKEGDDYANHIFNSFERKEMVPMEFLRDDEIIQVLNYIEFASLSNPTLRSNDQRRSSQEGESIDTHSVDHPKDKDISFYKLVIICVLLFSIIIIGYLAFRIFKYLHAKDLSGQ